MADENGLLGDISGVLHSILGNEFVQGAGLVGATGLNPLIGLLAGPIIKDDRERRELENDLVRESLKDSRSRREGATRLAGILGQEAIPAGAPLDVLNLEGGILAQTPGIPGVVPSASQSRVPFIATPQGRQEALGASAQAAPAALVNQLAGGILGQESPRRQSVDARLQVGRELGLTGDELIQFVGGSTGSSPLEIMIADQQRQLNERRIAEQDAAAVERERELQQQSEQKELFEGNLVGSIRDLTEMAMLNEKISTGLQQTGLPLSEGRLAAGATIAAIGEGLGFDTSNIQSDVIGKSRFNKLKTAIQFDVLKDADLDRQTNQTLQTFFQQFPGEVADVANNLVIADQLEGRLRLADAKRVPIPQREQVEELIRALRASSGLGVGGKPEFQLTPDGRIVPVDGAS